jgi:hypothetical protein
MNNSNATVTPKKGRRHSAANLSGNATKASAKDLSKIVMEFRNDKKTPGKAINAMNRVFSNVLDTSSMDIEGKQLALGAAAEAAKVDALAAIDRQLSRGLKVAAIKRGTTGKGGIHHADVKSEVFGSGSKRTAVENNSRALRSAGLIS